MTAGNFDDSMRIDSVGRVAPSGPAKVAKGETDTEFYIWLQQPQAFMHCEAVLNPDGTAWVMKPDTAEYKGRFTPGSAVGTGMAVSVRDGQTTTFWWGEQVELTEA